MATAFCSNHDSTMLTGSSLTLQPKASESASAILTVEPELLHWPKSMYRGIPVPATVP
ncbi:hypothetical protein D3C87_2145210 [compost metagenome]